MAAGYTGASATDADLAKIHPGYAQYLPGLGVSVATNYIAEAYRQIYREIWEHCRGDGMDVTQIADSTVLKHAECYLTLALIYEALTGLTDTGENGSIRIARMWRDRYTQEMQAVRLSYDDTVGATTDTTTYTEPEYIWVRGA